MYRDADGVLGAGTSAATGCGVGRCASTSDDTGRGFERGGGLGRFGGGGGRNTGGGGGRVDRIASVCVSVLSLCDAMEFL